VSWYDSVSQRLNLKSPEDWYNVSRKDLRRVGGHFIVDNYFNGSIARALIHLYPNYEWEIWKFKAVPKGFWDDPRNQRAFFDFVGKRLGIKDYTGITLP
jgi:hypothetical protein